MSKAGRARRKKYFTVAEANAMLPLLRSILRDITELAANLRDREERLLRLRADEDMSLGSAYSEELDQIETEFELDQKKRAEYEQELRELGVELKDYFTGLVDFPAIVDGREVYLCWKLGEPEVEHWHELDAGFAGRQRIQEKVGSH